VLIDDQFASLRLEVTKLKNAQAAATFSALCAERHVACIATFCALEGADSQPYLAAMSAAWTSILVPDVRRLEQSKTELMQMIPHDEDFESVVAGQAQLGFLCAVHSIDILLGLNTRAASGSSDNALTSAEQVANYLETRIRKRTFIPNNTAKENIVTRELKKQAADLEDLVPREQFGAKYLNEARDLNFQFIIAPAVICWAPDLL
jgi:hypothetical protein